ncbi:hypothetical protein ACN4EK_06695 [Pantanalinema rosaneae CENA516]|uniref:hypothetical protein n=1 Tax=Pantanalinema rosaneae TaxID=1620701 RepID=UPI003D6F655E
MSNRIQAQATKLWQTIAAPETATSYRNVLSVTWTIVQEAAYLFWLVLCLGLVFVDWFWRLGYRSGSDLRNWMSNLEEPDPNRMLSTTGESLATVGKTGMIKVLNTAKAQLGMEVTEPPPAPVRPASAPVASISQPTPPEPPTTSGGTETESNPSDEE